MLWSPMNRLWYLLRFETKQVRTIFCVKSAILKYFIQSKVDYGKEKHESLKTVLIKQMRTYWKSRQILFELAHGLKCQTLKGKSIIKTMYYIITLVSSYTLGREYLLCLKTGITSSCEVDFVTWRTFQLQHQLVDKLGI